MNELNIFLFILVIGFILISYLFGYNKGFDKSSKLHEDIKEKYR